jgi:alpha-galactosidase
MTPTGSQQDVPEKFTGPAHWNGPDMLEIGNGGVSDAECQLHMSLWTMLSAPLLAGNDPSKMTPETKAILMNRHVVALHQDALGRPGKRIWAEGPMEIREKELSGGRRAVALFHRGESPLEFDPRLKVLTDMKVMRFEDLWTKKDIVLDSSAELRIPSHAVVLLGRL